MNDISDQHALAAALQPELGSPSVVCVLAEGTYFHGVAVLLNSLIRNGFAGEMVVGYRGALPPWVADLRGPADDTPRVVAPGVTVRFLTVGGAWCLSNMRAEFMQLVMDEIRPDFGTLYYFDADILIRCNWKHFVRWAGHGVLLTLDMSETYMPAQHAFRREWAAFAGRAGFACRSATGYVNGGCVGISNQNKRFIHTFARLMRQLEIEGLDMSKIKYSGGTPEFAKMDQDVLNATVMATDVPVALLGQEAMDIFPSAVIMTHYMIHGKPWARNYIKDALKGFAPDRNEFIFWDLVNNPVQSFTPAELRRKRLLLRLGKLMGHLRKRGVRE